MVVQRQHRRAAAVRYETGNQAGICSWRSSRFHSRTYASPYVIGAMASAHSYIADHARAKISGAPAPKTTAPRSPWQNEYAERVIGSIRRECLDRSIVRNQAHLRRILDRYIAYYNVTRTHLGLEKDSSYRRAIEHYGRIVARDIPGGLHHQYSRI